LPGHKFNRSVGFQLKTSKVKVARFQIKPRERRRKLHVSRSHFLRGGRGLIYCQRLRRSETKQSVLYHSGTRRRHCCLELREGEGSTDAQIQLLAIFYNRPNLNRDCKLIRCLHDRANIEQLTLRTMVISMLIRRTGGL